MVQEDIPAATGRGWRKGSLNVKVSMYKAEVHCGDRLHHADHVVCAGWVDPYTLHT